MTKKRANANTRPISDLLGSRHKDTLLLQRERGVYKGQSTALAAQPASIYFVFALRAHKGVLAVR
jgi:hypothetical protein